MANVTPGIVWTSGETVTPAKLNSAAAPVVTLNDGEVTTNKLADGAVTTPKLPATLDLSTKTVTLPDDSVTNDKLSLAADAGEIKKALNADNDPPIFACRAWVNFDGTVFEGASINGTYSRTGTTVTVTTTVDHGEKQGNRIFLSVSSGTVSTDEYNITSVLNSTQFTVTTSASTTTSGTLTIRRRLIRASGNVANVARLDTAGKYAVNFTTPMPDANYCVVNGSGDTGGATLAGIISPGPGSNANRFIFTTVSTGGNQLDRNTCMLAFFR